jgi:spore coat protein CotF
MFAYLEDHVRFITDNFLAGAANATRMYTPGMASPENTKSLREILKSACNAAKAFDEYTKEMQIHE